MIRQQSIGWMTLVLISLVGTYAMGQDEDAAKLYGLGLHAYFAGDYDSAVTLLSASIESHDSDPRAYYFRGLALASMAGLEAGLPDLTKGADIEVNQTDRPVYDINGALQRVQGSLRLELEKIRAATRKAAVVRKRKRDQVRYEALKRREDIVLFDPNRPAPQVQLDLPPPDLGGKPDPFTSGVAFSGGNKIDYVAPTPDEPAEAPVATGDGSAPRDPFAESGAKAPVEAADPFATPVRKTEPTAPQAEVAPADANPFGEGMPKLELEGVEESAVPAANAVGGLIDILGKTLSGQAGDRDPFGPPAQTAPTPGTAPDKKADATPPAAAPAGDPFAVPDEETPAAEAEPDKKADAPAPAPAGNAAPQEGASKKPGDQDADPFK